MTTPQAHVSVESATLLEAILNGTASLVLQGVTTEHTVDDVYEVLTRIEAHLSKLSGLDLRPGETP